MRWCGQGKLSQACLLPHGSTEQVHVLVNWLYGKERQQAARLPALANFHGLTAPTLADVRLPG